MTRTDLFLARASKKAQAEVLQPVPFFNYQLLKINKYLLSQIGTTF